MKKPSFKKIICLILAAAAVTLCIPSAVLAENGAAKGKITVNNSKVNVRTGPGTNYPVMKSNSGANIQLADGFEVEVGESKLSEDSQNPGYWYDVSFKLNGSDYSGYVYSKYVELTSSEVEIVIEQDFEAVIKNLPESYKDPLRKLHTLHPNWQFEILDTKLDWNTAVDNECVFGRSAVHATGSDRDPVSQWSTDPACYDWLTDTYTNTEEGTKYVQASRETIEHYMDPRNFFNETDIFQFETLSHVKGAQTIEGVEKILANNTFMKGAKISDGETMLTYPETFMRAAALSNVSPYHLAARCIQEIGNQLGKATSGKTAGYEGYYNFYNIGANTGVTAGLKYAKTGGNLSDEAKKKYMLPWNSQYKAIVGGAIFIGSTYINKGQNTLYLERFDVESEYNGLYWHQYMVNISAPYSEGRNIARTYRTLGLTDSPMSFLIPVYKNMPESPCPLPTKDGSINNHLKSLTVGDLPLTPTFSHDDNSYSIVLTDNAPSSVKITAVPVTDKAKVTGDTGEKKLKAGLNTFTITVTAENGDVNRYYVYVASSADLIPDETPKPPEDNGEQQNAPTGSFSISYPHSGSIITGLKIGATLDQLKSGLGLKGDAKATFTSHDGGNVTSGAVTTDILVTITADSKKQTYRTVVYGDVDCDGKVTAVDLLMVRRYMLGDWTPSAEAQKKAADADKDGKVTAVDLLMVRKQILGTYTIEQ